MYSKDMTAFSSKKSGCPVALTLNIIGKKWAALIIRDLLTGKKRFGELLASLACISPRTLSARLDELEQAGIITRRAFEEMPPRVEYGLTKRGTDLHRIIDQMARWGSRS